MEFRLRIFGLLLWFLPWVTHANDLLDEINTLVFQYPAEASKKITAQEKQFASADPENLSNLRLKLLQCELLLQLGDNQAAIHLAQTGEAMASALNAEHVRAYFMSCQADAYASIGKLDIAMPLLDGAISLAKRHQQPQALVMGLRLRAQLDTDNNNFTSAIEDLRLALDAYDDIPAQKEHWAWPPKAYVLAAMGNLLFSTGDPLQARVYTETALTLDEAKGKIRHVLLKNLAQIALHLNDLVATEAYLQEARTLLPELSSSLELAISYATIASIEIKRGYPDRAADLLDVALNTFEQQQLQVYAMRARKLKADVAFARNDNQAALALMADAIATATKLQLDYELANYQRLLANHFASKQQFQLAFTHLNASFDAAARANIAANNSQIQQFKARLSQRLNDANLEKTSNATRNERHTISGMYMLLIGVVLFPLGMVIWQIKRQLTQRQPEMAPQSLQQPQQRLEHAMNQAREAKDSLSLLRIQLTGIRLISQEELQQRLTQRLRQADFIVPLAGDDLLLVLPQTSSRSAEWLSRQLKSDSELFHQAGVVITLVNTHPFDTPETLLDRFNKSPRQPLRRSDLASA